MKDDGIKVDMSKIKGLATGIGSLPFTDVQKAVDLVLRSVPEAPFWPQLPKLDKREGMIAQFSENLPGLKFDSGSARFAPKDREKELELFYEKVIDGDIPFFEISKSYAQGLYSFYWRLKGMDLSRVEFIKCQVTGPFTFSAGITDPAGNSILHDKVLLQAMVKGLGMKALWQLQLFKGFRKKIAMFFDEPYLAAVGSAYTPVDRQEVINVYSDFAHTLKPHGCLMGVHCCGNTDWSMLTEIEGIDIINFDAFEFMERFLLYPENISNFLKRGGIICWGIVPTQGYDGTHSPEELVQKLKTGLDMLARKGISHQLLLDRLMISPACGLGSMSPWFAEGILELLSQTSAFIRKNF